MANRIFSNMASPFCGVQSIKVYDYSLSYSITEASSALRPERHPEAIPMPGPSRGDHLWQQHDHADPAHLALAGEKFAGDRKSTRLNSSHVKISYAVLC